MTRTEDFPLTLVNRRAALWHAGEDHAASMLESQGYTIIDRNWRAGRYEIDIIALDQNQLLVFLEIKTRLTTVEPGVSMYGLESITYSKQHKLVVATNIYLHNNNLVERGARLDVIVVNYRCKPGCRIINQEDVAVMDAESILKMLEPPVVTHIKQAFY